MKRRNGGTSKKAGKLWWYQNAKIWTKFHPKPRASPLVHYYMTHPLLFLAWRQGFYERDGELANLDVLVELDLKPKWRQMAAQRQG